MDGILFFPEFVAYILASLSDNLAVAMLPTSLVLYILCMIFHACVLHFVSKVLCVLTKRSVVAVHCDYLILFSWFVYSVICL